MAKYSIEIGLDAGGLISGSAQARQAIDALSRKMDEAYQKGDMATFGKLGASRDMLNAQSSQLGNDMRTLSQDPRLREFQMLRAQGKDVSRFTNDRDFMSKIGKLNDCQEKLITALNAVTAAIQQGDLDQMQQSIFGSYQQFQDFHHAAGDAANQNQNSRGKDLLQSIGIDKVISTVMSAATTYVAQLDRSSIINQAGSGNVAGAMIEQTHRDAAMKSTIGSGAASIIGGAIGTIIAPGIGTAIGASLGSAVGGIFGLMDEAKANKLATRDAYSQLWEQQMPAAMNLNASLGKTNSSDSIRATWKNAATAAANLGFSAEEGIEAVKRGASQGLTEKEALAAAQNTFSFERGIGADRNLALDFETRSKRFGNQDALGWAFRGNQASGMAPGQFNEFLRSIQRVFEDGISKGFVRGTQEIAGNMAFLSNLTNNSELWKGEQGAQRLSQMNAGLESATSLSSVTDILAFRSAQDMWRSMNDTDKNQFLNIDRNGGPDIQRFGGDAEYINAMMILERGLSPSLFGKQMALMNSAEGGSKAGMIERMRQMYGLNYTQSAQLFTSWEKNKDTKDKDGNDFFDSKEFAKELERIQSLPDPGQSKELEYLKKISEFKIDTTVFGQAFFNDKYQNLPGWIEEIKNKMLQDKKDLESESASILDIDLDLDKMTPQQILAAMNAANKAGNTEEAAKLQNWYDQAAAEAADPIQRISRYKNNINRGNLFDPKREKKELNNIFYALRPATEEYAGAEFDAANEAYTKLNRISQLPQEFLASLNQSDTFNSLANSSSAVTLLDSLNKLIESNKELKEELAKGVELIQ